MIFICGLLGFICERKLEIVSREERSMTFDQCSSHCNKIGGEIFNKNDVKNIQRDNVREKLYKATLVTTMNRNKTIPLVPKNDKVLFDMLLERMKFESWDRN